MISQFKKNLIFGLMTCSIFFVMATKSFSSDQEVLKGSDPYPWSCVYKVSPETDEGRKGTQVLHFSSNKYRSYTQNQYGQEFVNQYCAKATQFTTDADTLRFASDHARSQEVQGKERFILEMGTGAGKTTNFLAALNPFQTIYTFDSYQGLPEDWDKGADSRVIKQGSFARLDSKSTYLPPVLNNVFIHEGDFKTTLPLFKKQVLKQSPISLLNIDCDIYSSTKTVFDELDDNIVPGTVIHFDEGYNYATYKDGEWKALLEFVKKKNYEFEVLAFNTTHEQVVVEIKTKP